MSEAAVPSTYIAPIETEYKGYRFRSRLEARWAVFFDTLGIEWEYEVEGFQKGGDVRYLPDFFLPKTQTWIEVKGSTEKLHEDRRKLEPALIKPSLLPHFDESHEWDDGKISDTTRGLIILGNVPESIHGITLHPIIRQASFLPEDTCLLWSWCAFEGLDIRVYQEFGSVLGYLTRDPVPWCVDYFQFRTPYGIEKVASAYHAARRARFEYGGSP